MSDMNFDTSKLKTNLSDNSPDNMIELQIELEKLERNSETTAMSDHQLFLQGKKAMLSDIINYIDKIQ